MADQNETGNRLRMAQTVTGSVLNLGKHTHDEWKVGPEGMYFTRNKDEFFRLLPTGAELSLGRHHDVKRWGFGPDGVYLEREGSKFYRLSTNGSARFLGSCPDSMWSNFYVSSYIRLGDKEGEYNLLLDNGTRLFLGSPREMRVSLLPEGLCLEYDDNEFVFISPSGIKQSLGRHSCIEWRVGLHGLYLKCPHDEFFLVVVKV